MLLHSRLYKFGEILKRKIGEKRDGKLIFKGMISENFPNCGKDRKVQFHEDQMTLSQSKQKK
jgi:hypothetical protein